MQTIQKRAAIGGEIGANGEFYEGGKFIATKDNAKGAPKAKALVCRKVQIAPYQWEVQPAPEHEPIFRHVGAALKVVSFDYETKACVLEVFQPYVNASCNNITPEYLSQLKRLVARFNAGERWI